MAATGTAVLAGQRYGGQPLPSTGCMESAQTRPTGATTVLRGLRCIRLSVLTDETTSPERQREADDKVAAELGIDFGEGDALREAVDLDVSASKFGPFDRPQLGKWLGRPEEFDALVWWRFDRAIRSMEHMHELAKWARAHRKMLVFAEGIGGGGQLVFDFRNPMDPVSELMMTFFAFAAQVEAQSIKERITGAQAALRSMPYRFRGGKPIFGYMSAPMPKEHGGIGRILVPDPVAVRVIERLVRDLLGGVALTDLCTALNGEGVLSPGTTGRTSRAVRRVARRAGARERSR